MRKLEILVCIVVLSIGCGTRPAREHKPVISTADTALSSAQIQALAVRILENTPEHLHWAPGTTFDWVLIDPTHIEAPEVVRSEVLRRLKQKYTVYQSDKDIPDNDKETINGQLAGYTKGFSFNFKLRFEDELVHIDYSDWEGVLAASWHTVTYRWNGKEWAVVRTGPMTVS